MFSLSSSSFRILETVVVVEGFAVVLVVVVVVASVVVVGFCVVVVVSFLGAGVADKSSNQGGIAWLVVDGVTLGSQV